MSSRLLRLIAGLTWVGMSAMTGATDNDGIASRFRDIYPHTRIDTVRPSPISGLYEVIMGANVVYASADGRYVLFGHLFDMHDQRDLTAAVKQDQPRVNIDSLALAQEDAMVVIKGSGARTLIVFTDPLCPHCIALESELRQLKNVTLKLYVASLIEPQSDADRQRIHRQAACGNDTGKCTAKLARNRALFDRLKLPGTPTLIDRNGRIAAGFMSADAISQWLDSPTPSTKELQ